MTYPSNVCVMCNFYFLTDKGANGLCTCHIENAYHDATHIAYTCNSRRPYSHAWRTFRMTLEKSICDPTSLRNHINWKLDIHRVKQHIKQYEAAYGSSAIVKSPRDWIEDSLETRPTPISSHHPTVLNLEKPGISASVIH